VWSPCLVPLGAGGRPRIGFAGIAPFRTARWRIPLTTERIVRRVLAEYRSSSVVVRPSCCSRRGESRFRPPKNSAIRAMLGPALSSLGRRLGVLNG
jgi:hypothetical protein